FTGWSGDEPCSGSSPTLSFTVTAPVACVAGYVRRVVVAGAVGGGGAAQVTATSPDAHSVCAGQSCAADAGAAVTLLAPTVPGYRLPGWSGAGCEAGVAAGAGLTITAAANVTCTATYVEGVAVSGTVVGALGQVSVASATPGASCAAGACALDAGGSVTLT